MPILATCDSDERYAIVGRAPFFHAEVPFEESRDNAVISEVRQYALEHRMDFLLARSFGPGQFNTPAEGPTLNLCAMHVLPLEKGVVAVMAYSTESPAPQDKALTREFLERVTKAANPTGAQ
jgi:hypothetical protein